MSYKKKHSGYGKYAPMAMLAITLATQGCKEGNPPTEKDKIEQQGLLDPTPEVVQDKYGSSVKLIQIEIPVYERDGKIKENYEILTRGQNPEHFAKYDIGEPQVRKVYFNNSPESVYVMTGRYGEITDKHGRWVGLIADIQGKVIPLAVENAEQYRMDYERMLNGTSISKRYSRQGLEKNIVSKTPTDSVMVDSLSNHNDGVNGPDSIENKHSSDIQVIDTIAKTNIYE